MQESHLLSCKVASQAGLQLACLFCFCRGSIDVLLVLLRKYQNIKIIFPQSLVTGNWGQWSIIGQCTKTCGNGTLTKSRFCNNPAPLNGGLQCVDASGNRNLTETLQNEPCNTQPCPGLSSNFLKIFLSDFY